MSGTVSTTDKILLGGPAGDLGVTLPTLTGWAGRLMPMLRFLGVFGQVTVAVGGAANARGGIFSGAAVPLLSTGCSLAAAGAGGFAGLAGSLSDQPARDGLWGPAMGSLMRISRECRTAGALMSTGGFTVAGGPDLASGPGLVAAQNAPLIVQNYDLLATDAFVLAGAGMFGAVYPVETPLITVSVAAADALATLQRDVLELVTAPDQICAAFDAIAAGIRLADPLPWAADPRVDALAVQSGQDALAAEGVAVAGVAF